MMSRRQTQLAIVMILLLVVAVACALSGAVSATLTVPPTTSVYILFTATPQDLNVVTIAPPNLGITIVVNPPGPGTTPAISLVTLTPPPQLTLINGTPCAIPAGWLPYTIQSGDTLSSLAVQSATTVDQIATANCLGNVDTIDVGQIIYLPNIPPPTLTPVTM